MQYVTNSAAIDEARIDAPAQQRHCVVNYQALVIGIIGHADALAGFGKVDGVLHRGIDAAGIKILHRQRHLEELGMAAAHPHHAIEFERSESDVERGEILVSLVGNIMEINHEHGTDAPVIAGARVAAVVIRSGIDDRYTIADLDLAVGYRLALGGAQRHRQVVGYVECAVICFNHRRLRRIDEPSR